MGVAGVQTRISRTSMMSTQNSCVPIRNAINSRLFVSLAIWTRSSYLLVFVRSNVSAPK